MNFAQIESGAPRCVVASNLPSRWRQSLALAVVLATAAGHASAQPAPPLTYVDILHQLTDLDRLTHLQTGTKGGLFSSGDRNSKTRWGANGDAGQSLRVEPNGEAVMMDIDGPGVICRIWSANPMGKLLIYLDGAQTPSFEWNFPDLFDGNLTPFIKPLVRSGHHLCATSRSAPGRRGEDGQGEASARIVNPAARSGAGRALTT